MALKKVLVFIILFSACMQAVGQVPYGTHTLMGTAGGTTTTTDYTYAWSLGEAVVFNQETVQPSGVLAAQGMQTYDAPFINDNCFRISMDSYTEQLCGNPVAFATVLSYSVNGSVFPDEVQWYYSEKVLTEKDGYNRISGATSLTSNSFKPFFPGYYRVRLRSVLHNCESWSEPVEVLLSNSSLTTPVILSDGAPVRSLAVSYDQSPGVPGVQWFAYIPWLQKYLLVAGGTQPMLPVRYNGDYMVMVTYPNGCRLSAATTVSGHKKTLLRTSDILITGNTVHIPEETAYPVSSLKVYPNPASASFTVEYQSSSEPVHMAELYSGTGSLIRVIEMEGEQWSKIVVENTRDLNAGVYYIKVYESGKQIVEKLVISK